MKDKNGVEINVGDIAYYIEGDDPNEWDTPGRIHTGKIVMDRQEWSLEDQKNFNVPPFIDVLSFQYDEAPEIFPNHKPMMAVQDMQDAIVVVVGQPPKN